MRIWRDIPTYETLLPVFGAPGFKHSEAAGGSWSDILRLVAAYHDVKKDDYGMLATRRDQLDQIAARIDAVVNTKKVDRDLRHKLANARDSDTFLAALGRRARAKSQYLSYLLEYYRVNRGEIADPQDLIRRITAPRNVHPNQPVPLVQGVRLEQIDPVHRDWELRLEGDDPYPLGKVHQSLCCQWWRRVKAGTYNQPFFIFLENTEVCLDVETAKATHNVEYVNPDHLRNRVFALRVDGRQGKVSQHEPGRDASEWKPFDTQWVDRSYSEKGGAVHALAYVWIRGELFADLHNPLKQPKTKLKDRDWDTFHHSSFASGGDVGCAGMIAGMEGKVTYIDNDSGHYQPQMEHLHALVHSLFRDTALHRDARVRDLDPRLGATRAHSMDGIPYGDYLEGRYN